MLGRVIILGHAILKGRTASFDLNGLHSKYSVHDDESVSLFTTSILLYCESVYRRHHLCINCRGLVCVCLLALGEPAAAEVVLILAAWATKGWEIATGTWGFWVPTCCLPGALSQSPLVQETDTVWIPPLRESLLTFVLKGSQPSCLRKTIWAQLNFLSLELVAIPIIIFKHHRKKPSNLYLMLLFLWGTGSGLTRPFHQAIISGIIFRDPLRSDDSRGSTERAQQPITGLRRFLELCHHSPASNVLPLSACSTRSPCSPASVTAGNKGETCTWPTFFLLPLAKKPPPNPEKNMSSVALFCSCEILFAVEQDISKFPSTQDQVLHYWFIFPVGFKAR